tara:strand:+ start:192 stop:1034 length:843 start_codon:yes stop_codon:yes gene_type:complete
MEPSRDDFVIAIRSAFLKKDTQQRFSLLALLFFSILLIVLGKFNFPVTNYLKKGINEVVYRVSFVASLPEKYISYSYNAVQNHLNIYKDYSSIEKELEKLKTQKYQAKFLESENKRLKKVLDDINYSSKSRIAKILIDKQSPFLKSVVVNKGSNNNIKKGMAVLEDSYLVGKIVDVNYTTSRVLLLSDLNSKIPVTIEPGGIQSILSGDGDESGIIQYTKDNISIEKNSVVYTSGAGGLLKAGIPIGKIIQNENQDKVIFFKNFSQLRYVTVSSYVEEKY